MESLDQVPFGALLKRHRLAEGLTQEVLAERAGVSAKAVSDLEREPTRTPRLGTVRLLADALGLSPDVRAVFIAAARSTPTGLDAPAIDQTTAVMPRPLTPLVGRAGVVAAVAEIVSRGDIQLLALNGPGGVGKTRVALEVAARVSDLFSDGAFFIDLAPLRDPALVLPTIARGLGIDEREVTPLQERLISSLRSKQLLLLLDNFEQVVAAGPDVITLLASCPQVVVLTTSRVTLNLRGGRNYPIAPLALPDGQDPPEILMRAPAVELFMDRARAIGVEQRLDGDDLNAVVEVCRRLEGLPLAIELAAARLSLLAPRELAARLDRRLPLLVVGPRDLPARQATMRAAIAWSYDLLDAAEQALFRRVCVFSGGCTVEDAELVCGPAEERQAVVDGLATLVENSLLTVVEMHSDGPAPVQQERRLLVLETIREYGIEQLALEDELDQVLKRHAERYLALTEEASSRLSGADAPAWLARLDLEHENIRAALRWAFEHRDGGTALRFAGALWPFWHQRGHLREGRQWLRKAQALPSSTDVSLSVRVNALVGAATLAIDQAAYDEAEELTTLAMTLAREGVQVSDFVAALNVRGLLAGVQGRYSDSIDDYQHGLSLAREAEDRRGEAVALLGLAYGAMVTGDAGAAAALEEGLTIARELDDPQLLARALFLAAWRGANTGEYGHAEELATEALDLQASLGAGGERGELLFLLATVALFRGEHEHAARLFEDSLGISRIRGDERMLARDLGGLASAVLNLGDFQRARSLAEESLVLARNYRDPWSTAMALTLLGHVELAQRAVERASGRLTEAAGFFRTIGNLMYLPWCLEGFVGVAVSRGEYERAAELLGACDAVRRTSAVLVPPVHAIAHARTMATVRTAMSQDAFDAACAKGEAMDPEEILYAIQR